MGVNGHATITRYVFETMVHEDEGDVAEERWTTYLLDLMEARGYTVLGGPWVEYPSPQLVRYPRGFHLIRAQVLVHEFDVEV